ncbi:hypothetical protein K488DRAFT_74687 [Vararia minispora EC-137]|uniref:Uncharacterized protein n=1 Tax=Vararia minispora EC-137 TaxID=1314806 RepID=A0ACB8Q6F9_9AGAM|nr:hypothetical protein K488DRAFT_74687 [Vararia minispora EC-137]
MLYSEGGIEWNYPDIVSAYWVSCQPTARIPSQLGSASCAIEALQPPTVHMDWGRLSARGPDGIFGFERALLLWGLNISELGGNIQHWNSIAHDMASVFDTLDDIEFTPAKDTTPHGDRCASGKGAASGVSDASGVDRSAGAGPGASDANDVVHVSKAPSRRHNRPGSPSTGSQALDTNNVASDKMGPAQTRQGKRTRNPPAAAPEPDAEGDINGGKRKRSRTAKGEQWREAIDAQAARHKARIAGHSRGVGSRDSEGERGNGRGRGCGHGRGRGRGCGTGCSG